MKYNPRTEAQFKPSVSVKRACYELGISPSTFYRKAKQLDIPLEKEAGQKVRSFLDRTDLVRLQELYGRADITDPKSIREVAAALGTSPATVRRLVKKHNLKRVWRHGRLCVDETQLSAIKRPGNYARLSRPVTIEEACAELGIARSTLWRRCRKHYVYGVWHDGKKYYDGATLARRLSEATHNGAGAVPSVPATPPAAPAQQAEQHTEFYRTETGALTGLKPLERRYGW